MYFLHRIWVYSFKIKPLDLHVKKLNEERQYEIKRLKHGIQVIIVNCNIDFIENMNTSFHHVYIDWDWNNEHNHIFATERAFIEIENW